MKLLASLIFFTRLPFWKIANVPPVYFKRVVDYWPFVGWLTGGIMAGTLWITAEFLPVQIAVLMALAARLLVTGALHEDGLVGRIQAHTLLDGLHAGRHVRVLRVYGIHRK